MMDDLEALREELRRGLANLEEEQKEFVHRMVDKIDKAEQSMVLEILAGMNNRLGAIEEKLAENDRDKQDGDGDDEPYAVPVKKNQFG